jgi:hypothetical protein
MDKLDGRILAALILQRVHEYQLRDLVEKMDGQLLARKIDAETLAAKVLPYMDLKVDVVTRSGPTHKIDITGFKTKNTHSTALCPPEEKLVSGGYYASGYPYPTVLGFGKGDTSNSWSTSASFNADSEFITYAHCLRLSWR